MDGAAGLQVDMKGTTARVQRVTLAIDGLSYARTGGPAVDGALRAVRGVIHVYINPSIEMAYVEFDPSQVSPGDIRNAVQSAGYLVGELCLR